VDHKNNAFTNGYGRETGNAEPLRRLDGSSRRVASNAPQRYHFIRGNRIVKKADGAANTRKRARPGADAKGPLLPRPLHDAMPESDPAYPILAGILSVVPASRWTFARVQPNGELDALFGSHSNGGRRSALADELKRQRIKAPRGPRIAATLGPLETFASGITLLFADARAHFGILTLLRTAELGPFSASEISMLTFALDALSDLLSALRLQPQSKEAPAPAPIFTQTAHAPEPPEGAFYVLDRDLQIVLAWTSEDERRIALTGLQTRIAERLPVVLEETVRELTAAWSGDALKARSAARAASFLVVRTQPMSGPAGLFIGVRIDRFQPPNSLTGAASRFHISPREVQVLALLLDGNHLDQIAAQLHITSSTVQDHIKSMLDKTGSGNRSELIARVLGWESAPHAQQT
jgi:DNA-binding CsgD family transcriptional regulator